VQEYEFELQVGDTLQLDEYTVTIVDIDGDEISVRIDSEDDLAQLKDEDGVVLSDH
jgi:co-chaperonin GroES (HSP10)